MNTQRTIYILITTAIILGMTYFGLRFYIESTERIAREKAIQENILDGEQHEPIVVEVDYSKQIADGSPLVFGGSHSPPPEHGGAWDELKNTGITMLRKDLYIEFTLPRNISIEDYKNNKNNVQDPSTWDQKTITNIKTAIRSAKERGISVMGIMGYAPKWLTHDGTAFGVPKDWQVYGDIVEKIYSLYRDDLDYVEIWNEPDHRIFLTTENSNLTKQEAYTNIYITSSNSIKSVDNNKKDGKFVKIGAGVESNPRVSNIAEYLITEGDINIKPDFLSFHTYDSFEESLKKYREISAKIDNVPIFITEWNYESRDKYTSDYKTGNRAFIFTTKRLIDYLNNGVNGANYFAMLPVNTNNRGTNENTMGFYKWENNHVSLLPQANSWKILSKSMGLGSGESRIVKVVTDIDTPTLGFINHFGSKGAIVVNENIESQFVEIKFKNAEIKNRASASIYIASETQDGEKEVLARTLYPDDNNEYKFRYILQPNSVIGVTLKEEKQWYDIFDPIIK